MTTYKWTFMQFDTMPEFNGMENVVTAIHWRLDGVDGDKAGARAGTISLGLPDPSGEFIAYADLTEAWAQERVLEQTPDVEKEVDERLTLVLPPSKSELPPFVEQPAAINAEYPNVNA